MNSKNDKIGVAVVGLGVGEQHARAYLANGRCDLRWLYDLDLQKAQRMVSELGSGSVANSFEQVVSALNVEKHVFVEKPLCRSVGELQVIRAIWAKQHGKLKLASNLVLRAAPLYRWLKEKISGGDFGDLYAFD